VLVVIFNLERVIEHVVSHRIRIGPVPRHAVDVGRRFLAQFRAGARLVPPVRLGCAEPETERLVRRFLPEERREVRGIIRCPDGGRRRLGFDLTEIRAGQLPRFAVDFARIARTPAFARKADRITVAAERLHETAKLSRKIARVVRRFLQLPAISAREHAGARRRTLGVRRVCAHEQQPFTRHAIEGRGVDPLRAIRARMRKRLIVGDDEEDIRAIGVRRASGRHKDEADENRTKRRTREHTLGIEGGVVRPQATG
jgi:hypothetical protein